MVLGYFGSNYCKRNPTKDRSNDHATGKKIKIHKENNDIVNHASYEMTLEETNKFSDEAEAHGNNKSEIIENDLYKIENMSLDEKK